MNTEWRSRTPRSAAVSAEDQPQRPRIPASTRWNPRCPTRPACCGWCSAHTAALREKSSRRARIVQSCSTEWRGRNEGGARGAARVEANSASLHSEYAVRAFALSRSAFLPISAVFSGNAPIVGARNGTPRRSEGTQSGKEPRERPRNRTADAQREGRNAAVRECGRIGPGNLGQGNRKGRSGGGLNWPAVRR